MNVRIQLFAVARQLAGREAIELSLPDGATIGQLRRALADSTSALGAVLPHVVFAVNAEYADDASVIPPGASIACIPPVSGG